LNTCGHSPYETSSLTRGWVCRLKLLLDLASAFILRSESRKTHDQIFLSPSRDSPTLEVQVPVFMSPFIASYDSQGYGGGIRSRFYTGLLMQ
jgi:hypothetical protein